MSEETVRAGCGIDPDRLYSAADTMKVLSIKSGTTLWSLNARGVLKPLYPFENSVRRFRGSDILALFNKQPPDRRPAA